MVLQIYCLGPKMRLAHHGKEGTASKATCLVTGMREGRGGTKVLLPPSRMLPSDLMTPNRLYCSKVPPSLSATLGNQPQHMSFVDIQAQTETALRAHCGLPEPFFFLGQDCPLLLSLNSEVT